MRLKCGHGIGLVILFVVCCLVCLAGCEGKDSPTTDQDAETILRVMVVDLEEAESTEKLSWVIGSDEVDEYIQGYYGLSGVTDGAIVRMEGSEHSDWLSCVQKSLWQMGFSSIYLLEKEPLWAMRLRRQIWWKMGRSTTGMIDVFWLSARTQTR